ncbi:hypothetical protein [Streptomyces sp. NPDC054887]
MRVKLLHELPVELPMEAGRWLAFPADRLDEAVSILGLHDLRPATTVMGVAAATEATDSVDFQDALEQTQTAYRVFITPEFTSGCTEPELDNWRLLYGNSFLDDLDGFALADKLSEQCAEAHFYVIDPYNGSEAWYIARNGHQVRSYGTYDCPQFTGEPLPFEVSYREDGVDEAEAEEYAEGVPYTSTAADHLSVEPGPMLAESTHRHGWLATTHPAVLGARFKGALPA